jgi:hypothetical protein
MTLLLLALLLQSRPQNPEEITGNASLFLGAKQLDDSDWEPVEDHLELAALLDARVGYWPVNIACDFRWSFDEDDDTLVDIEARTFELNLGVRKYLEFHPGGFQFFVGGGFTLGYAWIETSTFLGTTDDTAVGGGFWLDAGASFVLPNGLSLGFEIGYTRLPVEFDDSGADVEAGGVRFGATVGFHW